MTKSQSSKLNAFNQLVGTKNQPILAIVNHVSRSGMSRRIELYTIVDGQFQRIGYNVAKLLELPYNADKGGITVSGCGMDMCFHLVSSLNYKMCAMENPEMSFAEQSERFGRIYDNYWFNADRIQS